MLYDCVMIVLISDCDCGHCATELHVVESRLHVVGQFWPYFPYTQTNGEVVGARVGVSVGMEGEWVGVKVGEEGIRVGGRVGREGASVGLRVGEGEVIKSRYSFE